MILRAYLDRPQLLAPDPGEVVYARRSEKDRFTLAVVEKAWRDRAGNIRVRLVWLEEDEAASPGEKESDHHNRYVDKGKPLLMSRDVAPGETGWITMRQQLGESPLMKRIDVDELPPGALKRHMQRRTAGSRP